MKKNNRDLLVLLKQELMTPKTIETEIENLHHLLFQVERLSNIASAHELIDLNRYKIIKSAFEVRNMVKSNKEKPFVFLNNLN